MSPLTLNGANLGARHQELNQKVNTAVKENIPFEDVKNIEEASDIDFLYIIDIAAKYRNLEYLLEILKSEDSLYVARVIKQCTWLISDKQYAHIVNPDYLYHHLFPYMTSKAQHKFILHVRLYLKDEQRAEQFYNYYIDNKQTNIAVKWLPYCSVTFIEKQIEHVYNELDLKLIGRLVERSLSVLKLYNKHCQYISYRDIYETGLIWLRDKTESFLDIIEEKDRPYLIPQFSEKQTKLLLKKCPNRILNNFKTYHNKVSQKAVGEYLGKENIKDFLLKNSTKENEDWFQVHYLKDLIDMMPFDGKFELIRNLFIDKNHLKDTTGDKIECALQRGDYEWYKYATFQTAFSEIIKLVRTEPSPYERVSMLSCLVSCANQNQENIKSILQYYQNNHINEPYTFKVPFVNTILKETSTHRYDECCWNILDNIFRSMGVYEESKNYEQEFLSAIIMYKLVHDKPIPEIIERKKKFSSMKVSVFRKLKLTTEEKDKVFNYLYNILKAKINLQEIQNLNEFSTVIDNITKIVNLFNDWERDIIQCSFVIESILNLIKLMKDKEWNCDLESLYNSNRKLRKYLFEYSLVMCQKEEVCLNVLKHDAALFERYRAELDELRSKTGNTGAPLLDHLHKKVRVYWPRTSYDWISTYREWLQQTNVLKSAAAVRGLCLLLPQKDLHDFIKKNAPSNMEIDWNTADEQLVSLQKNISRQMHIARPQPSPDFVITYAKGHYLQFALPSLMAIFYNISTEKCREHIPQLLSAPVSVKKNGIRIAFSRLKQDEILQIFSNIWDSTKNASIKAVLFQYTKELLCKQNNDVNATKIWDLLSKFIDDLTDKELNEIYTSLKKVYNVPRCVRAAFCIKSYNFLKTLPAKAGCESYVNDVAFIAGSLIDIIDPQFVYEIIDTYLKNSLDDLIKENSLGNVLKNSISHYLLYVCDEETQMIRYNQVLVPLTNRIFERWDEDRKYKDFFWDILQDITTKFNNFLSVKDIVVPVLIFTDIQNRVAQKISSTLFKDYSSFTTLKLTTQVLNHLNNESYQRHVKSDKDDDADSCATELWQKALRQVLQKFAKSISELLRDDANNLFPSIYLLFHKALNIVLDQLNTDMLYRLDLCEALLQFSDNITYLIIIKLLPKQIYGNDEELLNKSKEIKKAILAFSSAEVKLHYYNKFNDID